MIIAKRASHILLKGILLMPLYSVGQETTSTIEHQATSFLNSLYSEQFPDAQIKINITPLSARFRNYSCNTPLQFSPPRRLTQQPLIKISCDNSSTAPSSWTLFVKGKASVQRNALAVRARVSRGQPLDASLLEVVLIDALRHQQAVSSMDELANTVAARVLPPGKVLTKRDVTLAPAIRKGDAIMIEARRGGLSIRTSGIAQQSGHIGEQIRAINNRSGKEVHGMIRSKGLIIVP